MGVRVGKLCALWLLLLQIQGLWNAAEGQNLQAGFYQLTCPTAETIVTNAVTQAFLADNTIAAGLIRLFFHDCFVSGCDASIMLTGNNTEQTALPNLSVRGYTVIDNVKAQLETLCPGIVSCADLIALAARDAVHLVGGPAFQMLTGRLDGLAPGPVTLPGPADGVLTVTPIFEAVGLSKQDMVTLLGAHSVGTSQCQFFVNRLYNFNNTGLPDPGLNTTLLATLQAACPLNGTGLNLVPLDPSSEFLLDTNYYTNIKRGEGILIIDQEISTNVNTSVWVNQFIGNTTMNVTFGDNFVAALNRMGSIGLKTSVDGEVRTTCTIPNS